MKRLDSVAQYLGYQDFSAFCRWDVLTEIYRTAQWISGLHVFWGFCVIALRFVRLPYSLARQWLRRQMQPGS